MELAAAALRVDDESFVVQVASVRETTNIHHSRQTQFASLNVKGVTIPAEYSDYTDVFSLDSVDDKQPPYGPIYTLGPVELETFKTYIKTNLANGFIRPATSPAGAPILFIRTKDRILCLYVDYRGLNNLIFKKRYSLPLIGESFDRLGHAKHFTQLDLTNAYH